MAFVAIIAVIILSTLTLPVVADITVGPQALPGSALYGLERFGENIRSAFGTLSAKDVAQERIDEAIKLAKNGLPEKALETLEDADAASLSIPTSSRAATQAKITEIRDAVNSGVIS